MVTSSRKSSTRGGRLRDLLHAESGPLTRELLRAPGRFGLGQVPARLAPDATTSMVCGYCSTGCGLTVHLKDGEAVALTPTTGYPVNLGMACPKGWEALTVLDAPDRATVPLLRDESGVRRPVDWGTALKTFVARIQTIQRKHGPESVAFLGTGQIPTEEMALLGALAKFGMGIRHGDGNTRQCMASAVVAYKQAFGFDAPPYTYADFEESDCLVFIGANPCIAHPILWERVMRNRHRPEIIVIDPRRTETAMQSTLHLPVTPKGDLALLYGLACVLVERGWIDQNFITVSTSGFEAFAEFVQSFPPERVERESGIDRAALDDFARRIHEHRRVSFWWTMGVNQSHQGVRTAQAIINVALMTGSIGRPGTGANSITGQCNAMGSRLFSNTTNLLGGHDFQNAEHRRKVADVLGIDEARIPRDAGWAYPEIIEGILAGKIKALWVVGTNPAHSWINQNSLRDILGRLEFLVVQDMYHSTETAELADLLLPAAAWGEKEGTFINSERRIGVIKKVRRPPGQALADFDIFRLVAERWNCGCGKMFARWTSPEAVFGILKELSIGQPCDISGLGDYRMIDTAGGVQWPYPSGGFKRGLAPFARNGFLEVDALGKWCLTPLETSASEHADTAPERRLFADGRFFHPDGRARFLFEEPRPLTEPPTERFPFILLTGRGSASQWHTQTRTAKSAVLRKLDPAHQYVEINPADAARLGIKPRQRVWVESQRGRLQAQAVLTYAVRPGQVFLPMHDRTTNQLTDAVFDPHSRQPGYKACAVRVLPES